jgi:rhamnulose-1-phosphate aldolase/alcohol dehydrogenase
MSDQELEALIASLIEQSNELGADPRNTNYGGGNTSAKGRASDPVTGLPIDVMWVKGSGGDLGTLTESGLAGLDLGRVRAMEAVYDGDEDDVHRRLSFCAFGTGAAPSIDTTMHALLGAPHVDHLHPDSVIALATAADGEELTKDCFGGTVAWIPWIRPGFDLALKLREIVATNEDVIGAVLGGHGLTTWASTSAECRDRSPALIATATDFIASRGKADPLGGIRPGFGPLKAESRVERARTLAPMIRGLVSTDRRMIGHWRDDVILNFIASNKAPTVIPLGTSCPDHLIRTKVRPLLLDLPSDAPVADQVERLAVLHEEYRAEYQAYYDAFADSDSPAMRGADPAIVLIPGVGMFSYGPDSQTERIAGEFYVNAINVITGAEAVSSYQPISDAEKFRVEYWDLEEEKLRRRPAPRLLSGRVAAVTGAASGIGKAIATRLHQEGAVVAPLDINAARAEGVAESLGNTDTTLAVEVDVTSEVAVENAINSVVARFGGVDIIVNNAGLSASKPRVETTAEDWNLQYDVMARGSFFVAKHGAKAMITQSTGGDIVYIASKNAIVGGPNNVAYGSAKASQAHQVRLLAAELAEHDIRVNSVNPDGVVRGSGIFEGEWGRSRAEVYGVERSELGEFYAQRTLLKKEVLPEHIADAVFVFVGGELPRTTGHFIGVDGGLPAAFPR